MNEMYCPQDEMYMRLNEKDRKNRTSCDWAKHISSLFIAFE
jgi:hypothetical protein